MSISCRFDILIISVFYTIKDLIAKSMPIFSKVAILPISEDTGREENRREEERREENRIEEKRMRLI